MIADCAVFDHGVRRPGSLAVDRAFDALEDDGVGVRLVWIELVEPTESEVAQVANELQLHPLVIEDVLKAHQRPKLEVYPSSAFLVMKTVGSAVPELCFGEVSVILGDRFIVTVRHGASDPVPLAREYLTQRPEFLTHGPSAVLYAITNTIVDSYAESCDGVEASVDSIEDRVFTQELVNAGAQIFATKRSTLTFLRNVEPSADVFGRFEAAELPLAIPEEVRPYLRDIHDHLHRVTSRLEQSRDLLTAALEINHAQIGIRQNEDMRAMSGWAAIIAVPTLLAGIWGMNFKHMPELGTAWGYVVALGLLVASSYVVYRILKRNGWM